LLKRRVVLQHKFPYIRLKKMNLLEIMLKNSPPLIKSLSSAECKFAFFDSQICSASLNLTFCLKYLTHLCLYWTQSLAHLTGNRNTALE
jgi:hypothetical protein